MKIYVIGRYEDRKTIREMMNKFTEDGHVITHDWTRDENGVDQRHTRLDKLDDLRICSYQDLIGVDVANAVVIIHHDQLCNGLVELGRATADPDKVICIIGPCDPVGRRIPLAYWSKGARFFSDIDNVRIFLRQLEKTKWE